MTSPLTIVSLSERKVNAVGDDFRRREEAPESAPKQANFIDFARESLRYNQQFDWVVTLK